MKTVIIFCLLPWPAYGDLLEVRDAPKTEMRRVVDRVDELLGGTRTDDRQTSSTLRLRASGESTRFTGNHAEFTAKFNLKLGVVQQWQDRFNHWLQHHWQMLKEEIEPRQNAASPVAGQRHEESSSAVKSPVKDPWRLSFEKHLTVSLHPDFWLHARVAKDWEFTSVLNTFSVEAGWSLSHKWESFSSFSTSTHLSSRWALNATNQARWQISDKSFGTAHATSLAYLPGDEQVVTASISLMTAVRDRTWYADGYSVAMGYRVTAWGDWIYVGAGTSVTWLKSARFAADPGVNAHVELVY